MIVSLSIENYVLIQRLKMDFDSGFSVITGETGAGKSILLGALSLILGKRADTSVLLDKSSKCIIEGCFRITNYGLNEFFDRNDLDYEDQTTLRREINSSGKTRAFINDTPVNLNILKELGEKLVDIHSQHSLLKLNSPDFQLAVLDNFASNEHILKKYQDSFKNYRQALNDLKLLEEKEQRIVSEQDYLQFQFEELEKANLESEDQQELETERNLLEHAEEIKTGLLKSIQFLSESETNAVSLLAEISSTLSDISKYNQLIAELGERIGSNLIDLKDIAGELESLEEGIEFDPVRHQEISDRLDEIYRLQQKHRVDSIAGLLNLKEELSKRLKQISSVGAELESIKSFINKLRKELTERAEELSEIRQKAAPKLTDEILAVLKDLSMPDANINILLNKQEDFGPTGKDNISFKFTANPGTPLKEVSKVASGGELSRLMLAIKSVISQQKLMPTVIFDEIDLGVSGEVAGRAGTIMQRLSDILQVIAITHLPQIAGKGKTQFLVYKAREDKKVRTEIKRLNSEERVSEIAKMLSTKQVTSASLETAKELLGK